MDPLRVPLDLIAHGGGTGRTEVFIFVSLGQDQEQPFSDRHGLSTFWTIQGTGLKLIILSPGSGYDPRRIGIFPIKIHKLPLVFLFE
jgi:hypothetical protein